MRYWIVDRRDKVCQPVHQKCAVPTERLLDGQKRYVVVQAETGVGAFYAAGFTSPLIPVSAKLVDNVPFVQDRQRLLAKIDRAWSPEVRFMQFLCNLGLPSTLTTDHFYLEDNALEAALDRWLEDHPE